MPLYDSFSAGSQKSVKLSKMSSVPTTEDLKYAVAEAKKQGKPVELPFENNRILFVIKVTLQGNAAPRWTFQKGDGAGARILWNRDSAEVLMIQNKIRTESGYEQHQQDSGQDLSASGGFGAYQPNMASGGLQAYQPVTSMSASGGFPAYQEPEAGPEPDYSDGTAGGGDPGIPNTPYSQPPKQVPFNVGAGAPGFPNAPFNVQSSSGSQPLFQDSTAGDPSGSPSGGIPETPFSSSISATRMTAFGGGAPGPAASSQVQQSTSGRHQSAGEPPKILLPPKPLMGGFGGETDESAKSWQESAQEKGSIGQPESTAPGISSFRQAPQFPKFDSDEDPAPVAPAIQSPKLAPMPRPAMRLPMAHQFDNSALNSVFSKLLSIRTNLLTFDALQFFLLREFSRFQQYEQSLAVVVFEVAIRDGDQMSAVPFEAFATIANRLRSICSPLEIAAHISDSDFIVLLSNGEDGFVNKFMEELSKVLISTPLLPSLGPGSAMVAIGAASIPNTCNHPGVLIAAAKAAKEEAKGLSPSYLLFPTGK